MRPPLSLQAWEPLLTKPRSPRRLRLTVLLPRRQFVDGPWQHRLERVTGSLMVGLGLRLALESR